MKESEAIHGKVSMYNQVFEKPKEQQKIMMKKSTKNMGKFGYGMTVGTTLLVIKTLMDKALVKPRNLSF